MVEDDGVQKMNSIILSEIDARKAWAQHASAHHRWPDAALPEQEENGRFSCGWHESEFQIFYAGVKYAINKAKTS